MWLPCGFRKNTFKAFAKLFLIHSMVVSGDKLISYFQSFKAENQHKPTHKSKHKSKVPSGRSPWLNSCDTLQMSGQNHAKQEWQ
jgi:hypothetical protein